ncbi:Methionyl-tRNA formyltransferase [Orbilia oligospora]|uniref:methionyl-tRNA formyltransferase n=1 Tax=Orbilia oligospora TaxID=2813651 RepID=A0A7C8PLQ3_ORBOL|nr:Methionyl-tRNA formyltransferase [Orbilia oligospora]KAF3109584.1 Methionyl-tRNA formyltransferase [Orbilia oligospora]KAF3138761.1 Methionyl-tRNA formyltransferase [Orbilia oligospora]KAF3149762.1 Methionyl-tRNA formyltransferase [Orbilia oligospora]KAF3171519.1 Methionyl-tRNA formyltransferase [Orbilia oligospora]
MSLPRLVFRPAYLRSSSSSLSCRPILSRSFHASRFDLGIKILFCGSDDFSLRSLKALQAIQESTQNSSIESIDVVIKHEKPSGRGLKGHRANPIRDFAESKSLNIFSLDEEQFNDWEPPRTVDLIIAVSFGLFIPSRILEYARFGGLNVHPSFLPKYWGASPIQHAIINDDKTTGVVVQTLHPEKFDAGRIIAKSDPVDIEVDTTIFPPPISHPESPYRKLESKLGDIGASLLTDVIKNQHYDHVVQQRLPEVETGETRKRAPLLTTEDSRIIFEEMTGREVFLRSLVFDHLFCYRRKLKASKKAQHFVRMTMGPFRLPTPEEHKSYLKGAKESTQWLFVPHTSPVTGKRVKGKPGSVALQIRPEEWVCFESCTVAGKSKQNAKAWDQVDRKAVKLFSWDSEKGSK